MWKVNHIVVINISIIYYFVHYIFYFPLINTIIKIDLSLISFSRSYV